MTTTRSFIYASLAALTLVGSASARQAGTRNTNTDVRTRALELGNHTAGTVGNGSSQTFDGYQLGVSGNVAADAGFNASAARPGTRGANGQGGVENTNTRNRTDAVSASDHSAAVIGGGAAQGVDLSLGSVTGNITVRSGFNLNPN